MNNNEEDLQFPDMFSETWDPSNHARLQFPILEHPDARPEQAPSQGVRELLYQYEAVQQVSRGPLNIFWNDEGNEHSINSEEGFNLNNIEDPDARRTSACNGVTVVAGLIILCSVTALMVGTVCVFGQCGGETGRLYGTGNSNIDPPPPQMRPPSAAPTSKVLGIFIFDDDDSNTPAEESDTDGNIFTRPIDRFPPTSAPTTASPTTGPPTTVGPTVTPGRPSANPTSAPPTSLRPTTLMPTLKLTAEDESNNEMSSPTFLEDTISNSSNYNQTNTIIVVLSNNTNVTTMASLTNATTTSNSTASNEPTDNSTNAPTIASMDVNNNSTTTNQSSSSFSSSSITRNVP